MPDERSHFFLTDILELSAGKLPLSSLWNVPKKKTAKNPAIKTSFHAREQDVVDIFSYLCGSYLLRKKEELGYNFISCNSPRLQIHQWLSSILSQMIFVSQIWTGFSFGFFFNRNLIPNKINPFSQECNKYYKHFSFLSAFLTATKKKKIECMTPNREQNMGLHLQQATWRQQAQKHHGYPKLKNKINSWSLRRRRSQRNKSGHGTNREEKEREKKMNIRL